MKEITLTVFIWSLSFSLIGLYIAPNVDTYLAVLIRISCGLILFMPLVRKTTVKTALQLMLIGACQFGITYMLLYRSYSYISTIEVLIFSITTPIYIVLINGFFQKKINMHSLIAAAIAVVGAGIIRYNKLSGDYLIGFLLMQLANISFAFGQVLYQRIGKKTGSLTMNNFFWFFVGAFVVVLPCFLILGDFRFNPSTSTYLSLIYVGFLATGLGQFLWCRGATKINNATLSVMNNAYLPLGIVINLFFGGTLGNIPLFTVGTAVIILSLFVCRSPKTD